MVPNQKQAASGVSRVRNRQVQWLRKPSELVLEEGGTNYDGLEDLSTHPAHYEFLLATSLAGYDNFESDDETRC